MGNSIHASLSGKPTPPPLQQQQQPVQQQPLPRQHLPHYRLSRGLRPSPGCGSDDDGGELDVVLPSRFNDDDPLAQDAAVAASALEPEPDVCEDGPLSLSVRVEFQSVAQGRSRTLFGLATVKAAEAQVDAAAATTQGERQAMDLVCVLDVSGSMGGDKIHELKKAVRFVIDQLEPRDRLSIVTFNEKGQRRLPLRRMDDGGRSDAIAVTLQLEAAGGTSIAAGLEVALAVVEQRRQRNKVTAILLLTDGQDQSASRHLTKQLRRAAAAGSSLYAFGFGADHDSQMLLQIAEYARTPYTFVEQAELIREAFAGLVGGLSSVVAQSIELQLALHVPLQTVHTPFEVRRLPTDASGAAGASGAGPVQEVATVMIPDIFSGERKDVLLELQVPADIAGTGLDGQAVLLQALLQYQDLSRNLRVRTAPVALTVRCADEQQPEAEPDEEVADQRDRVEVARALEQAAAASNLGDFARAQNLLEVQQQKVKSRLTPTCQALDEELSDAHRRMADEAAWGSAGRAEVQDALQMHRMQRCTNTYASSSAPSAGQMSSKKAMYTSPATRQMISKSKA